MKAFRLLVSEISSAMDRQSKLAHTMNANPWLIESLTAVSKSHDNSKMSRAWANNSSAARSNGFVRRRTEGGARKWIYVYVS